MQVTILMLCVTLPMVIQENQHPMTTQPAENTAVQSQADWPNDLALSLRQDYDPNDWADSVWHGHVPSRQLAGDWQLSWNDDIATTAESYSRQCVARLKEMDGVISGDFVGPVAGRERNAIISGRVEGDGQTRVLHFQQRENSYICSYQGIENGGEINGVWHDTQNRSGRFRLRKHQ